MNKAEAIWIIDDRVGGIYNDLRSFVYIRINSLQNIDRGLGGGNVTQAIALFSLLNFLGKIQYYFDKMQRLQLSEEGEPSIIEEQAFIHLVRKLNDEGINLGLPPGKSATLKLVWNGFRNKLAHVSNPEDGKQIMVYVIDDRTGGLTVDDLLARVQEQAAFTHDGSYRNWHLNADILLAKLPRIKEIIKQQLHEKDEDLDYNILEKIIG